MSLRVLSLLSAVSLIVCTPAFAQSQASGSVAAPPVGTITVSRAIAYLVRDPRNPRVTGTEILLTDVAVPAADIQAALNPHMVAINEDALRDRNYVVLGVSAEGTVSMNATFSKTMTQFIDYTNGGLKVTWTTRSASRLEGRVFSNGPVKTMDGATYTVDVKFAVDVPAAPAGQALAAGGGDPGKALLALLASAQKKDWAAIRAASSPNALKTFDKSYNSPAENAADALDLLKAWLPTPKMKVTAGQLRGDVAILDVEGEMFPGQMGLSVVKMVKTGTAWQFDSAARAGMVK